MDMTIKETQQAVEAMYHNLNTLQSRQVISFHLLLLIMELALYQKGRMELLKHFLKVLKGIGKFHRTSIFPCGIFQCMKG